MATSPPLLAVVYVSSARRPLDAGQFDRLLARSRTHNAAAGVTGVLLHGDGAFLQHLEGPPEGVARIWARVSACTLHHRVTELLREPVAQRQFAHWHMGFAEAPSSMLQAAARSRWLAGIDQLPPPEQAPEALLLLIDFWQRATRLAATRAASAAPPLSPSNQEAV